MNPGPRNRPPRGRRRPGAVALASGVAGVLAAGTLGVVAIAPFDIVDSTPLPASGEIAFTWTPPLRETPTTPAKPTSTSADLAVAAALGDGVFTGFGPTAAATSDLYPDAVTPGCSPGAGRSPITGGMRRTHDGRDNLTVSVGAYPAGGGAATVAAMRTALDECAGRMSAQLSSATTPAQNGFATTARNGSDAISTLTWNRGDLVISVIATGRRYHPPALARLAGRVDTATVAALQTSCLDLAPAAADAGRNPYNPGKYTGFLQPAVLAVAPPAAERLEVRVRAATPGVATSGVTAAVPELAPVELPAGWVQGDPVPATEDADRGPAPVLPDPDSIAVPDGAVTSEPTPPGQVEKARGRASFDLTRPDPEGPGCGWAFTGTPPAQVDQPLLDAQARTAAEAAFVELTVAAARTQVAQAGRAWAQARYERDQKGWEAYLGYLEQVQAAKNARYSAEVRYYESVAVLDQLRREYEFANQPVEPPTPTPSEQPTTDPSGGSGPSNPRPTDPAPSEQPPAPGESPQPTPRPGATP